MHPTQFPPTSSVAHIEPAEGQPPYFLIGPQDPDQISFTGNLDDMKTALDDAHHRILTLRAGTARVAFFSRLILAGSVGIGLAMAISGLVTSHTAEHDEEEKAAHFHKTMIAAYITVRSVVDLGCAFFDWRSRLNHGTGLPMGGDCVGNVVAWFARRCGADFTTARVYGHSLSNLERLWRTLVVVTMNLTEKPRHAEGHEQTASADTLIESVMRAVARAIGDPHRLAESMGLVACTAGDVVTQALYLAKHQKTEELENQCRFLQGMLAVIQRAPESPNEEKPGSPVAHTSTPLLGGKDSGPAFAARTKKSVRYYTWPTKANAAVQTEQNNVGIQTEPGTTAQQETQTELPARREGTRTLRRALREMKIRTDPERKQQAAATGNSKKPGEQALPEVY